MKHKINADQVKANIELLQNAQDDIKKIVPMFLYIDRRTGRQMKSHLNFEEFKQHLKDLKKNKQ